MPPRKTRLRKREPTPEPSDDEKSIVATIPEESNTQIANLDAAPVVVDAAPQVDAAPHEEPIVTKIDDVKNDDVDADDDVDDKLESVAHAAKKAKSSVGPTPRKPKVDDDDNNNKNDNNDDDDDDDDDLVARSVRSNQLAAAAAAAAAPIAAPAGPLRRLMIKEMVLENFKSYAGTQLIGPFHKVTARFFFFFFFFFFSPTALFFFFFFSVFLLLLVRMAVANQM
jgi:hypothetical protein